MRRWEGDGGVFGEGEGGSVGLAEDMVVERSRLRGETRKVKRREVWEVCGGRAAGGRNAGEAKGEGMGIRRLWRVQRIRFCNGRPVPYAVVRWC